MEDEESGKPTYGDEKMREEEIRMEDGESDKLPYNDQKIKTEEIRMEDGESDKLPYNDEKIKTEEIRMEDGESDNHAYVHEKIKTEEIRTDVGESDKPPYIDENLTEEQVSPIEDCTSPQKLHSILFNKGDHLNLDPSRKRRVRLSALILFAFSMERISYYGVQANLVLYATTHIGYGDLDAATIFSVYVGFNLIFSFVVGILSDAFIGTFRTTVISFCVYIMGLLLLPVSDLQSADWFDLALSEEARKAIFLTSLVLIAVGSGGYLATILPFGAHHIEPLGPKTTSSFYMWAYWAQNAPLLLVFSVLVYLQQSVSFFWGYFLPFCTTVIAFLLFLAGKNYYIRPKVEGSTIRLLFSVLRDGMCSSRPTSESSVSAQGGFLATARSSCGGRHSDKTVDNVKDLLRVIPVALLTILYWCTYLQYGSAFLSQAIRMDLTAGDLQIPGSSLLLIAVIIVVLFIPLINQQLIPYMEKIGHPLTPFRRMAIGMVFIILGVACAGFLETYRKGEMDEPGCSFIQEVSDRNFTASCVSVFLQLPQYSLYAIAEIFTVPAAQELSFVEAPESMKALVSGMFVAAMGLGGLSAMVVARLVTLATSGDNVWLGEEANDVKMENYFFLLAGLMGLNLLLLLVYAYFYKYRSDRNRPRSRSESIWTLTNFSRGARMSLSAQGMDSTVLY